MLGDFMDRSRADAGSNLARMVLTREVDGAKLTLEVSPCSWMYAGYGLQVEISMVGGGSAFIHNKALLFENATSADLESLFDSVRIVKCSRCGRPAFDHKAVSTNRAGLCESCFMSDLDEEFAEAQKEEANRFDLLDAQHRKEGFTHRVDAWIHAGRGEDTQISFYMVRPTDADIRRALRKNKSRVLDDYSVNEL